MTAADLTSIAACSLDADGTAARAAGFRALLAPNLRRLRRRGTRAELDLALDRAEERALAHLLELEHECCPSGASRSPGAHRTSCASRFGRKRLTRRLSTPSSP